MRSSTYALLWEIWRLKRHLIAAIVGLTLAGRLLDFSERPYMEGPTLVPMEGTTLVLMEGTTLVVPNQSNGAGTSSAVDLLWMVSFLLLFGVFNYTESGDSRGVGRFPHRLFTLPVSSLRLVTIPVLTGVASIELLYLLWLEPLSRGGSTSPVFVAVLLAGLMVFYQTGLWTLDRLGPLRIVVLGAVAIVMFGIGVSPSFSPSPPPPWRTETALAALVAGMAVAAFLLAWQRVGHLRCGGGHRVGQLDRLVASVAAAIPARRRPFRSPAAAHFWFEWRCSGLALPMLVGGVLVIALGPLSWMARDDAGRTVQLLFAALATPIVLAIPTGFGFGRPTFWSEDLALPAFVAVRPLADEDIVATKVKVALASAVASWLLVLSFLAGWLLMWANLDSFSRFAVQWRALTAESMAAMFGIFVLGVAAGVLLTWRFLVSRLWTGLSGSRRLFSASVMSFVIIVSVGMGFEAAGLTGWTVEDPGRVAAVGWIAVIAVAAKYGLAAYSWRRVSGRYVRQYLLVWGAGTACVVTLAVLLCAVAHARMALDIYRFQELMILVALLAVPFARVGLAPSCLARNRHR